MQEAEPVDEFNIEGFISIMQFPCKKNRDLIDFVAVLFDVYGDVMLFEELFTIISGR